ncbi:unnamed protein product [Musa acuminata subsp. malaccensis]|uniref:(wild Malaysian banana) hypothetical protein n=1 Tax=Musa acuminata subsp. malaccensis TaxID=214687 RepID=A0A804K2E9_MUSAM|nr:unnamed protein product [Musa acuminata subsp. malaccensis]
MAAAAMVAVAITAAAEVAEEEVAIEEEAAAEEVGGSYSEEERWGSASVRSTRNAAAEGNRRWR